VAQFATLVLLAALGVGCKNESTTAGPTPDDPLVAKLISLGFRRDMIEDRGDYFVVEDDIEISKRSIAQLVEDAQGLRPDFQWRTTVTVGSTQVQNIRVNLAGLATQPAWQTAAREALTKWNNANCSNVRLVEGTPAHITFTTNSEASNVAARATWPADAPAGSGLPGPTIRVNTAYTGTPNNSSTKLRNMVHEIGHTLGFRHTNWQDNESAGSIGANLIPGTPQKDPISVMNGGTATAAWGGFSLYDDIAIKTLYPNFTPSICVRSALSGPGQVWPYYTCTWTASLPTGGTPPYTYYWMGLASASRTFLYRNPGLDFTMRLSVTDAVGRRDHHFQYVRVYQYGPSCG